MSADDILYGPIGNIADGLHHILLDKIRQATKGACDIEFSVDLNLSNLIYDEVADLVEQHPSIITYTEKFVSRGGVRPANALTIKDVFRRLYAGIDEFWFCGSANGGGIAHYRFTNYFGIAQMLPIVQIDTKSVLLADKFEWWILGLMTEFSGYQQYYSFGSLDDARKYYAIP